MIVIIPCGGKKRSVASIAAELYVGPYFRGCLAYARSLVSDADIYVLSAKYGLVTLVDELEPYDLRMGNAGCVTPRRVQEQAAAMGVLDERVVALGGVDYTRVVRAVWRSVTTPLTGVGGIGKQLRWLKEHRSGGMP